MKKLVTLLLALALALTMCSAALAADVGIVLPTKDEPAGCKTRPALSRSSLTRTTPWKSSSARAPRRPS